MFPLKTLTLCVALFTPLDGGGFLGVALDDEQPIVSEVIDGSVAARSDIKVGDRFLAVGGKDVETTTAFIAAVGSHGAGDRVRFDLRRDEREFTLFVVLGERPAEFAVVPEEERQVVEGERVQIAEEKRVRASKAAEPTPDARVSRGRPFIGVSLNDDATVVETVAGGPADTAGVTVGDRIVRFGRTKVASTNDIVEALSALRPGQTLRIRVQQGEDARTLPLTLGVNSADPDKQIGTDEPPKRDREPAHDRIIVERAAEVRVERESDGQGAGGRRSATGEVGELREQLARLRDEITALKQLLQKLKKDG